MVVLEERGLGDLQLNALVSVYLRVLEYNVGILILTSNRVGTFDEAFKIPHPSRPALQEPRYFPAEKDLARFAHPYQRLVRKRHR